MSDDKKEINKILEQLEDKEYENVDETVNTIDVGGGNKKSTFSPMSPYK